MVAWITLAIVAATIIGIAVGSWPVLRTNRATIALLGSAMLLACGALSLDQAYEALDLDTLLLIFSLMLLNGFLFLAGFFGVVAQRLVRFARTPYTLLAVIIAASGVLSALFLNDTVVLMLTPLVIDTTLALRRNPLPYLLGLATAANVGSMATITGNPQNIVIGSASKIPYATFTAELAPTALIGLLICWVVIVVVYRKEFRGGVFEVPEMNRVKVYKPLLRKSAIVIPLMVVLFFVGVDVPLAAFLAAAVMLATRRLKPERVFATVDWSLLVFFAGLFIVTSSLEAQGWTEVLFRWMEPMTRAGLPWFALATVGLSNLISNVPAVLLLQHVVGGFADPQRAWLMLAAASTLAGNLTLLGSVANLIMAELAMRWNVRVTFMAYLKVGLPITILTVLTSILLI
jgi:Na+/H+ antiporter NhaD/arsenite permease-like protein